MRSASLLLCALLLSLMAAAQTSSKTPAKKPAPASDSDQIIALEKAQVAALVTHNVDALRRALPADYSAVNSSGQMMTAQQVIDEVKSGDLKLASEELDDMAVRTFGTAAVLTGRATVKGTSKGKDVSGQYRFTRVYVKRSGAWVPVAYQTTRIAGK